MNQTINVSRWANNKDKSDSLYQVKRLANIIARKAGCGRATTIEFEDVESGYVKDHINYGYRKCSTGEYVPKKYLSNFGWKNTFYQEAQTVVVLPIKYAPLVA